AGGGDEAAWRRHYGQGRREPDSSPRRRGEAMTREGTSKLERRRVRMPHALPALVPVIAAASPAAVLAATNGGQAAPSGSVAAAPQVRPVARPSGPENPAFRLAAPPTSFVGSKVRVTGLVRRGARRVVRVQYRTRG